MTYMFCLDLVPADKSEQWMEDVDGCLVDIPDTEKPETFPVTDTQGTEHDVPSEYFDVVNNDANDDDTEWLDECDY